MAIDSSYSRYLVLGAKLSGKGLQANAESRRRDVLDINHTRSTYAQAMDMPSETVVVYQPPKQQYEKEHLDLWQAEFMMLRPFPGRPLLPIIPEPDRPTPEPQPEDPCQDMAGVINGLQQTIATEEFTIKAAELELLDSQITSERREQLNAIIEGAKQGIVDAKQQIENMKKAMSDMGC